MLKKFAPALLAIVALLATTTLTACPPAEGEGEGE